MATKTLRSVENPAPPKRKTSGGGTGTSTSTRSVSRNSTDDSAEATSPAAPTAVQLDVSNADDVFPTISQVALPSMDPRTKLPIIDLPEEMRKRRLLAPFVGSVLHWLDEVDRHNRFYHSERRLVLVTDECIYTAPAKPNATAFSRCIPINMLGRIIISDDGWTNILVKGEHDLRIKPPISSRNELFNILKIIYRRLVKTDLMITNEPLVAAKRVLRLEKDKRWTLNLLHPRSKAALFKHLSSDNTLRKLSLANDPFEEGFDEMEANDGVTDGKHDQKTMELMACLEEDPDLDPLRYKIIHAPAEPAMPLTDAQILGDDYRPPEKLMGTTIFGTAISFGMATVTVAADAEDDDGIPVSFNVGNVATQAPVADAVPFPEENREMLNFMETQDEDQVDQQIQKAILPPGVLAKKQAEKARRPPKFVDDVFVDDHKVKTFEEEELKNQIALNDGPPSRDDHEAQSPTESSGEVSPVQAPPKKPVDSRPPHRAQVREFVCPASAVTCCCFSHDGKLVAATNRQGDLLVWDAADGSELFRLAHGGAALTCAFSPVKYQILTGGDSKILKMWNLADGDACGDSVIKFKGHSDLIYCVTFSANGDYFASASGDCTTKIWKTDDGKKLVSLRGHTAAVFGTAFSNSAKHVVTSGNDKSVRVWHWRKREQICCFEHTDLVWGCSFPSISGTVAFCCANGDIKVWDWRGHPDGSEMRTLSGHSEDCYQLTFTDDAKHAISVSADLDVRVWDVEKGVSLDRLTGHSEVVYHCALFGRTLISCGGNVVKMWSLDKVDKFPKT